MYIINDLNKLYLDVKNYIKGESLIQTNYLFNIVYNNIKHDVLFDIKNYYLEICIDNNKFDISFDDLEKFSLEHTTSLIYDFILNTINVREVISNLYLEESYSNKIISLSKIDNKISLLYFSETKDISSKTHKPFFHIKKETIINNIDNISISSFEEGSYYLFIDADNTSYSMKLIDNNQLLELEQLISVFN